MTSEERGFVSGACAAFNEVLGFINTLEDREVPKGVLYHAVADMRPSELLRKRLDVPRESSAENTTLSETYGASGQSVCH